MDCQIFLHFNSDESGELTQPEIGKLAGLSKQRVGQSIASGIRKLRQHFYLKKVVSFMTTF